VQGHISDNYNNYPSKLTKLPDPNLLNDGKSPSFKSWLVEIRSKFDVNRDYYNIELAWIAYIFSYIMGIAKEHL
jgi:hypothetical protein